jgi:hypothetical protein
MKKLQLKLNPRGVSKTLTELMSQANDVSKKPVWDVVIASTGFTVDERWFFTRQLLETHADKFNGARAILRSDMEHHWNENKQAENVAGYFTGAKFVETGENEGDLVATFTLVNKGVDISDAINTAQKDGVELLGLSLVAVTEVDFEEFNGKTVKVPTNILRVESVDIVVDPNAGGKFLKLVSQALLPSKGVTSMSFLEKLAKSRKKTEEGKKTETTAQAEADDNNQKTTDTDPAKTERETTAQAEGTEETTEAGNSQEDKTEISSQAATDKNTTVGPELAETRRLNEETKELNKETKSMIASMATAKSQGLFSQLVSQSQLPEQAKKTLRNMFPKKTLIDEKKLRQTVESFTAMAAHFSSQGNVTGIPGKIEVTVDVADKCQDAIKGWLDGKSHNNVPIISSMAEFRSVMFGEGFVPSLTNLGKGLPTKHAELMAQATTVSSWPAVLANVLNNILVERSMSTILGSWRKVATIKPLTDFEERNITRVGSFRNYPEIPDNQDVGETDPTADEKANYTPKIFADTFSIHLKALMNDNIDAVKETLNAFMQAGLWTVDNFVWSFFTDNDPTTYDAVAFIDAAHSNVAAGVLNQANLTSAIEAMLAQSELGDDSTRPIGIMPRFLNVPIGLWKTAFDLVGAARGDDRQTFEENFNIDINLTSGLSGIQWALTGDPNQKRIIEIGFVNGQEVPEITVQDSPASNSMFFGNKVTWKGQQGYGAAVVDHRGAQAKIS